MKALTPETIKPSRGSKHTSKRVGRGNASGKGTYAGRGMKGQRSRSGGKGGLKQHAFKQALQKVPKLRGFKSITPRKETVTLAQLEYVFNDGDFVSPATLKKNGVISKPKNGVKIVATGELKKKLDIKNCLASKKAMEMIENVGGSLTF